MIKHYVEFAHAGIFCSDTSSKEVPNRTDRPAMEHGYAWRFFDREEVEVNGEVLKGERKNISGWTYIGRIITLAEVEAAPPGTYGPALLSNMKGNKWDRVVRCRQGCVPLYPEDKVVAE